MFSSSQQNISAATAKKLKIELCNMMTLEINSVKKKIKTK